MDNLTQVLDTYLQSEEAHALQIDGKWGVGKTYLGRVDCFKIKQLTESLE